MIHQIASYRLSFIKLSQVELRYESLNLSVSIVSKLFVLNTTSGFFSYFRSGILPIYAIEEHEIFDYNTEMSI